jgi:phthiocerol/phenolphthiocerol synthesis type-I polyketide synthase C
MFSLPDDCDSYVKIYRHRAENQPEDLAYIFLEDGENKENKITFGELHHQALTVAAEIRSYIKEGDRALLVYQPGVEFIITFTACIYAGVIAVPVFPPQNQKDWPRFVKIVQDCRASLVCTAQSTFTMLEVAIKNTKKIANVSCIATDIVPNKTVLNANNENWVWPDSNLSTVMFLQYTSGSTGDPKGVMVSHGNLLHNEHINVSGLGHGSDISLVNWCPQYHDLGLIGNILLVPYIGRKLVLMSPIAFLQKPLRWLQAISKYKATASGGPNFAYELCLRKIKDEDLAALDLSSWDLAYSGAEMIRPATLERFYQRFKVCGFRKEAFRPVYGLAESTLIVTTSNGSKKYVSRYIDADALHLNKAIELDESNPKGRWLISCGQAVDQELQIINPNTLNTCSDNQVGEIWVKGKSVCQGYWNRPEVTKEIFQAYTADTLQGPFLRTGDLGFLSDGELFVTGRHKEVVIIDGRNLYPQDIEDVIQDGRMSLRSGCGAAFSVEVDGREQLVIVQELAKDISVKDVNFNALVTSIRKDVIDAFGAELFDFVLIKQGTFLKTSSGKIRRRSMRDKYLEKELAIVAQFPQDKILQSLAEADECEIDTHELKEELISVKSQPTESHSEIRNKLEQYLVHLVSAAIGLSANQIDVARPFNDYGLDSKSLVGMSGDVSDLLGRNLEPRLFYDYPSIGQLLNFLVPDKKVESKVQQTTFFQDTINNEPIAIVGMSCRYPGDVNTPEQFWDLLISNKEGLEEIPASRWKVGDYYHPDPAVAGKMQIKRGGFVSKVREFDAGFFNISPREAAAMDPQQRLLLEACWEALENACIAPSSLSGSNAGVYVGISNNDYDRLRSTTQNSVDAYSATGNAFSIAANRLSYVLNLNGPSQAVDTACSSSLVAIHQACQSLQTGESSLGLVGGVNLILTPDLSLTFSKARMMATDGRCKTFDDAADGYVRAEGCGFFVLKRLSDAEANGDPILALIKGSGLSQDGRSNGLTAPNGPSQELAIERALKKANLKPEDIQYVEAHGTGTPLGDPIEIEALNNVYCASRDKNAPLIVGSVKTNIGHLEAAAGMAGLSKVVLALQHKKIPAHLNCQIKNKLVQWDKLGLEIATSSQDWPTNNQQPRAAGISSFGFGGTNAHLIIEEYKPQNIQTLAVDKNVSSRQVLCISAKSPNALQANIAKQLDYLQSHKNIQWQDYCYSLNAGRDHFDYRVALCVESKAELIEELALIDTQKVSNNVFKQTLDGTGIRIKTAFMFTGQGAQYECMGAGLYQKEVVFKTAIDECENLLENIIDIPLTTLLFGNSKQALDQTQFTQPALFCLEYALAKLWLSWEVTPSYMIGHSVGEYAAACIADVFSLEDAIKLITARGKLMHHLDEPGSMLAVFSHAEDLAAEIAPYNHRVTIGAINGPGQVVLSGGEVELGIIAKSLEKKGIESRSLQVSHGFHSPLMAPMVSEFRQLAETINYSQPKISLVSNITGKIESSLFASADYWCEHILAPVFFEKGMHSLADQQANVFIEIGPQSTLTRMGRRCFEAVSHKGADRWIASLMPKSNDHYTIQDAMARYYVAGGAIDLNKVGSPGQKIIIPNYAFQRSEYWLSNLVQSKGAVIDLASHRDRNIRDNLIGERLRSPRLRPGEMHFNAYFNNQSPFLIKSFFRDSKASLQLPIFIEMMLESGAEAFNTTSVSIQDVDVNREEFGVLGDENINIQTFVEPMATNEIRVKCYLLRPDSLTTEDEWILLSSAIMRKAKLDGIADANRLTMLQDQITQELDTNKYFESCIDRGLYYCSGAPPRIHQLFKNETHVLSEVKLSNDYEYAKSGLRLPHSFIEAGFQSMGSLFYNEHEETFMPYGIGQIDVFSELDETGWIHISVTNRWEEKESHVQINLEWLNQDGQVAVKVSGMHFKAKKLPAIGVLQQLRNKDAEARHQQLSLFLRRLVSKGLGIEEEQIDENRSLMELGLDSLIAMEILGRVRFVLEVEINVVSLQKGISVSELTQLVDERLSLKFGCLENESEKQKIATEEILPLVILQKGMPGNIPIILVHPLGGSVFCYNDLSKALGNEQPLYALQAHGFIDQSLALNTIEAMASEYIREIRSIQPHGPYLLGGWSFGGIVCLEMAHQLTMQNESVDIIALVDSAPNVFRKINSDKDRDLFILNLVLLELGLEQANIEILEQLPSTDIIEHLHEKIKSQSRQPNVVVKKDVAHRINVMRKLLKVAEDYQPPKYFGSVSLFKAEQAMDKFKSLSNSLGWDDYVNNVDQVQTIPGNHFTLLHGSNVELLASYLKKRIRVNSKQNNRYFENPISDGYASSDNIAINYVELSDQAHVNGIIEVNEAHPFFFDHPLDHIPGTLIIESVCQLLGRLLKPIDPDNENLCPVINNFSISFRRWIEKDVTTEIALKLIDGSSTKLDFSGLISQSDITVSDLSVGIEYRPKANIINFIERSDLLEDKTLLHKKNIDNVLLQPIKSRGINQYECYLAMPSADHIFSSHFNQGLAPLIIIEAARQLVTFLAHKVYDISLKSRMNLVSIDYKVEKSFEINPNIILSHDVKSIQLNLASGISTFEVFVHSDKQLCASVIFTAQAVDENTYQQQRNQTKKNLNFKQNEVENVE